MSNYYYDEKPDYLAALSSVTPPDHDLTPFLAFALRGVAQQSRRLLSEIEHHISRSLYRNLMHDLFGRLRSPRKRVIAKRHLAILELLLDQERMGLDELASRTERHYASLKNPRKALARDLNQLLHLRAIGHERSESGAIAVHIRPSWPAEITETAFFRYIQTLPRAKTVIPGRP